MKAPKVRKGKERWTPALCAAITLSNIIIFLSALYLYGHAALGTQRQVPNTDGATEERGSAPVDSIASLLSVETTKSSSASAGRDATQRDVGAPKVAASVPSSEECTDPVWCTVPMPSKSYYKFDPPKDVHRWRAAQMMAARGDQVLLERIIRVFPNMYDYLDGDRSFRRLHLAIDIFVDEKSGLSSLKRSSKDVLEAQDRALGNEKASGAGPDSEGGGAADEPERAEGSTSAIAGQGSTGKRENARLNRDRRRLALTSADMRAQYGVRLRDGEAEKVISRAVKEREGRSESTTSSKNERAGGKDAAKDPKKGFMFKWEMEGRRVVPMPYNFRAADRAPVVQMGYTAFTRDLNAYFSGNFIGGAFIKRDAFLNEWKAIKDEIDMPFITVCALNENWGLISTMFPNRTAAWGACCQKKSDNVLHEFLNHEKTLMLVINQHSNLSHPKILTVPRGLPLQWENTHRLIWDSQRYVVNHVKKKTLLFAASSSWGARPQMIHCISEKMHPDDFEGHDATPKDVMAKTKLDRRRYYEKLGSTRFGVALPGLGYDCFRTWELLTMGSIVVIERGVGFDRTLWRLPALLLDDFYDITPTLLRQAYVEAMYRADEFEYERLTQSFWYSVIANVSYSKSLQPMLDKFPMEAEDSNFARPREPYACGKTNTCGKGTKRIPKNSC